MKNLVIPTHIQLHLESHQIVKSQSSTHSEFVKRKQLNKSIRNKNTIGLFIRELEYSKESVCIFGVTKTMLPGLIGDSINTSALLNIVFSEYICLLKLVIQLYALLCT